MNGVGALDWFRRSLGRVREGAKHHLINSGRVLNFDTKMIDQMLLLSDEDCEAIFLRQIEGSRGGAIDWRAKSEEIIEITKPFLAPEEQLLLAGLDIDYSWRPAEIIKHLDKLLIGQRHAIRALDTFGDAIFVVVIDKESEAVFDEVNRYWLL
jgi:hypothetical protein